VTTDLIISIKHYHLIVIAGLAYLYSSGNNLLYSIMHYPILSLRA